VRALIIAAATVLSIAAISSTASAQQYRHGWGGQGGWHGGGGQGGWHGGGGQGGGMVAADSMVEAASMVGAVSMVGAARVMPRNVCPTTMRAISRVLQFVCRTLANRLAFPDASPFPPREALERVIQN
jgi:hypothetical protein